MEWIIAALVVSNILAWKILFEVYLCRFIFPREGEPPIRLREVGPELLQRLFKRPIRKRRWDTGNGHS